jgi:hypothetical protein
MWRARVPIAVRAAGTVVLSLVVVFLATPARADVGTTPSPSSSPADMTTSSALPAATSAKATAAPTGTASPTATASSTSTGCPPAPPGKDKTDHGFLRIGPDVGTDGGVVVVRQPVSLTLYCFDLGMQQAEVTFSGINTTGATVDVPVLSGPTSFAFTGHQDPNVVDAQQTYTLDLTPLGQPSAIGWNLQVSVVIVEDRSASRTAPFVILPVQASPSPSPSSSPSVKPTHASRTPQPAPTPKPTAAVRGVSVRRSLPFTGSSQLGPLVIAGSLLVAIGMLLITRGRLRRPR